jgi:hypothetical protein
MISPPFSEPPPGEYRFSANRSVREYAERYYMPAASSTPCVLLTRAQWAQKS